MLFERSSPHLITIRQSRAGAVIVVAVWGFIIFLFEWLVFGMPTTVDEWLAMDKGFWEISGGGPFFWLVGGLPVFVLPTLFRNLLVILFGRVIVFDALAKEIRKNNKIMTRFDEIQDLNFRRWEDDTVTLEVLLGSGKKKKLGKVGNYHQLEKLKTEIYDILKRTEDSGAKPPPKDSMGKMMAFGRYLILGTSILFLAGAVYALASTLFCYVIGTKTHGTVIHIEKEVTERWKESGRVARPKRKVRVKTTAYLKTIEFKDADGNIHTFKSGTEYSGSRVPVVYLRFWPSIAKVQTFGGMWGAFIFLLVFGGLLYVVSMMFNPKTFEKRKKKAGKNDKGAA
jgi:hypothetical protein